MTAEHHTIISKNHTRRSTETQKINPTDGGDDTATVGLLLGRSLRGGVAGGSGGVAGLGRAEQAAVAGTH
jgi:hypothetical protein